jgi:hypothetical protein
MGDTDVLEGDVEFLCAFKEVCTDAVGHGFTLGDEFGGIKLSNDGFENFIPYGGEDALIVVCTKGLFIG